MSYQELILLTYHNKMIITALASSLFLYIRCRKYIQAFESIKMPIMIVNISNKNVLVKMVQIGSSTNTFLLYTVTVFSITLFIASLLTTPL